MRILNIIMLVLLLIGCSDKEKQKSKDAIVLPTSESKLVKIYSYDDKGKVKTIITGLRNVVFRDSKEIWLDKLRVLHIGIEKKKKVYIQLTADKGKVNYKTFDCEAWSNAVIVRENEVRIETERLFWDHEEKKVYTKDEEKVVMYKRTNPDDPKDKSMIKTIGKNLKADDILKTVELEEAISATPQKIKGKKF